MIRLENVVKTYESGLEAVRGVSFEVPEGEIAVLVGPSGCGKTTTMKMINRLIAITQGKIYVGDQDTDDMDPIELRQNIGYVIQDIGLFPHMTVAQNISTVPELKGWSRSKAKDRAAELLELVGMPPGKYINVYPNALSGGQKQRVGVARALAANPPIMLMDEPFGAIDPITRDHLQDEFLRLQKLIKKTIVFVTHDINEAIKMGDKIGIMRQGVMVQYDSPRGILAAPINDFVEDFVGYDRALKGLRLMRVGDVMNPVPDYVIQVSQALSTAREKMETLKRKHLLVVDEEYRFLGWLSLNRINKKDFQSIAEAVLPPVGTLSKETLVHEALSLMLSSDIAYLGVVDEHGKLIGFLSFNGIREALGDSFSEEGGASCM